MNSLNISASIVAFNIACLTSPFQIKIKKQFFCSVLFL